MGNLRTGLSYVVALFMAGTLFLNVACVNGAGQKKTFTGTVSDMMCGEYHYMGQAIARECNKRCVREGSKYALVVGSTVYELDGRTAGLDNLAGQKAKITGTVDGTKLEVQSVAAGT